MDLLRNGRPRVVITGLGALTSLGNANQTWESAKAGQSGIRRIETIDVSHVPVKIGGEIRDFKPSSLIDKKELRRMGRASQFAITTAEEALRDAGYAQSDLIEIGERVGVVIGTSLGAQEMSEQATTKYKTSGYKKPNPLALINALPNMPAHYVSRTWGAVGPLNAPSTACAAGTQAIGEATDLIRLGRADVVIAGGVEAIFQDYTIAGFEAMRALATGYENTPQEASKPFDLHRSGFVFSEGCALVIVESLAHALKRNAHIYAEVLGYATSSDAYHVAALDPQGHGATRSMRWALEDAHIEPDQVAYINAHGTGTPANDAMETLAIKRVFGEHAYKLKISSTKGVLGHAMAASGAIEAVLCAKVLEEQIIPPTVNLHTPDPECDLDYTPNHAYSDAKIDVLVSNSFGLGGQNASLVLGHL